jgi:carbamoyltransferase
VKVLGISCHYHDSAAALIVDGVPVAMAQEERFSRIKHDAGFPSRAIDFVMKGKSPTSPDYVVFYEKPFLKFERFIRSAVSFFPGSYGQFREGMARYLKEKLWIKAEIKQKLQVRDDQVLFVPHHYSHAASAFFCSPFRESAILTVDGAGEWTTTAIGRGLENRIELLKEIRYPHSLGLLYSTFTAFLGFRVNDGEYKVMGLAPYGKPVYVDDVLRLIDIREDGSFRLNLKYFSFHTSLTTPYSRAFPDLFGEPRRPDRDGTFDQRHADIAASIQQVTEDVLLKLARTSRELSGSKNLSFAGGVALNSVANFKLMKEAGFDHIFIQPAAGDAGGAPGAALYVYNHVMKNERRFVMDHAYYGPGYTDADTGAFLAAEKILHTRYGDDELLRVVARKIADGEVVGFFQGRSEWGPRALGNRSILADARRPEMAKRINETIKFREPFRPFAPSVLDGDAPALFDIPPGESPARFMQLVCPVRETVRKENLLPAITHVDGTARPHIVFKKTSERYYRLLQEFKTITGIGCVLNTSFNLSGEPVVESPADAYRTFCGSGMDLLVLNNYVVENNGKH